MFDIYKVCLGSLFTHFKSVYILIRSIDRFFVTEKEWKLFVVWNIGIGKASIQVYDIESKRNIVQMI